MNTTKRIFLAALCFCLLAGSTAWAQTQNNTPAPPELNITVGEQRLKFAPTKAFVEMRLNVFNSQGELVYGMATAEAELQWPVKTNNGEALTPGLYAYVLALKYGEGDERQHRGHFVVEKGQDQLWLTAENGTEISGTALNVARTGGRSIAAEGTSVKRDVNGREVVDEKGDKLTDKQKAAKGEKASLLVTPNRLTKYNGSGTIIDTINVNEDNSGNVGIGTATPAAVLDMVRPGAADVVFRMQNGTRAWSVGVSGAGDFWRIRDNTTGAARLAVSGTTGNIGIGTTSPGSIFHVNGPNEIYSTGAGAGFKFRDRFNTAEWVMYGLNGNFRFFTGGQNLIAITPTGTIFPYNGEVANANGVQDLGSAPFRWRNLFASGTVDTANVLASGTLSAGNNGFQVNATGNLVSVNNVPYSWPSAQAVGTQVLTNTAGNLSWTSLGGNVSGSCANTNFVTKWSSLNGVTCSQIFDDGTRVGIGTITPGNRLHVAENIITSGVAAAQIDFTPSTDSLFSLGLNVNSPQLTTKGNNTGIRALTSIDAPYFSGNWTGTADGRLATGASFNAVGHLIGVMGLSNPSNLHVVSPTQPSFAVGGLFRSAPTSSPTYNSGPVWVGGVYADISNTFDANPPSGAIAAVIGVDNATGTADHWAGYFAGKVRVTSLVAGPNTSLCISPSGDLSTCTSDLRLKSGIKPITNVLEKVGKLRGVSFNWNEASRVPVNLLAQRSIGVIAQEVEAAFPEAVATSAENGYKSVNYNSLTAVLIEAVKELKAENESLKQRIERLERKPESK